MTCAVNTNAVGVMLLPGNRAISLVCSAKNSSAFTSSSKAATPDHTLKLHVGVTGARPWAEDSKVNLCCSFSNNTN